MAELPTSPPVLRAGPVELRPFRPSDLPHLEAAFADPEIVAWNPGPAGGGEELAAWARNRNDWTPRTHASWAVGAPDGRLLGSVSLHRVDWDQADAEVGYWVAPHARGQGVAVTAVRAACGFAFEELGLHRVYLFHAVENPGSCGVARGAGFRHEGTLVQSHRFADGHYHDEHLHARLAGE